MRIAAILAFASFLLVACDEDPVYPWIEVTSLAFGDGETMPVRHTCDGGNISPPLSCSELPEGAVGVALIMDEPEAEEGVYTNWLLWGVPAASPTVQEDLPKSDNPGGGLSQGANSGGNSGYEGPCPGDEDFDQHAYVIRGFALDAMPQVDAGASRGALEAAIEGHIVGYGELRSFYRREN